MNKLTRASALIATLAICQAANAVNVYVREALISFGAGAAGAVVVGKLRQQLPEYQTLHADTGICRDQAQGMAALATGIGAATALAPENSRTLVLTRAACALAGVLAAAAVQHQVNKPK